jgi:hypothetical protein
VTVREPVLVMAFNRPDHLSVLMERLREVQPSQLFVAVDGPRPAREGEAERVQACRDLVATVDWPCEVHTLFQESNLGCGQGVTTAITWFFEHVERGIILEDDIIPDPSFFPYCEELLERYENDERVFAISGCNLVPPESQSHPDEPYRFSQVPHIWGWATWRRSWSQHRLDISGWRQELPPAKLWRRAGRSMPGAAFWGATFEMLARKEIDTWDGQLVLASMSSGQLTATSNVNLVENIGFGDQATHTFERMEGLRPVQPISLPIECPDFRLDHKADQWTRRNHFGATWSGMVNKAIKYVVRDRRRAA